jgi:hypothetical protein
MCFEWIWEQTAVISLYSINWLVFITETECLLRGTFCPHSVFVCFVWIWEQTEIISLYSINWLVFITETECLLRGTFCPHSVIMCFEWIWEQTAIISLYSINRLVFITETECVYCAVRSAHTLYLCVFLDVIKKSDNLKISEEQTCEIKTRYVLPTLYLCAFCGSENKPIISLYSIYWLVYITETECVYCVVRSAHTLYLCVCVDLRTNSDYFTVQH